MFSKLADFPILMCRRYAILNINNRVGSYTVVKSCCRSGPSERVGALLQCRRSSRHFADPSGVRAQMTSIPLATGTKLIKARSMRVPRNFINTS